MIDSRRFTTPAALLGAALLITSATLAASPAAAIQAQASTRLFRVEHASLDSARTLAQSICAAEMEQAARAADPSMPTCHVAVLERERTLAITAGAAVQSRIVDLIGALDRMPATRAFHIVVLAGSRSGSATADDIPEEARAALADVAEFLPYRSFRVLGSGWLRTSESGETTLPGSMEFVAGLYFRASSDPAAPILIERFQIEQIVPATYNQAGDVAEPTTSRGVLETTFTIDPGETVVVGTSKLNGEDGAIVVLLTAVAG